MNKPIYTMTDAELQTENNRLHRKIDELERALIDIAGEKDELEAMYEGLKNNIKKLANSLREEEKRHAGGRKSGGAGAGRV